MKNQNISDLITILTSTNSYLADIAKSVHVISVDPWVKWGALLSFTVGLIAILIAGKDFFYKLIFKPKIRIDPHPLALKQISGLVSRLTIRNINKQIAENVTFWVEKIWYEKNNKWIPADNFFQFPLRWTHTNDEYKNLHQARPYNLDLCEICPKNSNTKPSYEIHLCTLYTFPSFAGLDDIKKGENKILITVYCENHKIQHYEIEIDWDGTYQSPKIAISNIL
jgi:hypothetical protein